MNKKILVVLGSPNSPSGVLSSISRNRLDYCRKIYEKGNLILCTGGWGEHFNTSNKPHAFYAKNYLIKKGILKNCFLDLAISKNTVDDALKIKEIISASDKNHLIVITSDYHLERVILIFNELLKEYKIRFVGTKSNFGEERNALLARHEKKAIQLIKNRGLYY